MSTAFAFFDGSAVYDYVVRESRAARCHDVCCGYGKVR